jgi:hypothetical protein
MFAEKHSPHDMRLPLLRPAMKMFNKHQAEEIPVFGAAF